MNDPTTESMSHKRVKLPRQVKALGLVSFFNDTASEMIFPLLPAFLTSTLGLGPHVLGIMEGTAETVASLIKYLSGWWSDRIKKFKPLAVAGYTLSSALRPFMGIATTALQVVCIRVFDRVGKGVRTSPRDALLAASAGLDLRGKAFGFHRAMDHAGAVFGPLIALALLSWGHLDLRTLFMLTAIPGLFTILVISLFIKDQSAMHPGSSYLNISADMFEQADTQKIDRRGYGIFLIAMVLFTLGNSTDVFLVLHAQELGLPVAMIPVLWMVLHLSKSVFSTPGGALSDRIGRKFTILLGWIVYALAYLGFAIADRSWQIWPLFLFYGLFYGLTEGPEKALTADMVPPRLRGKGFGLYHMSVGIAALPASVLAGYLWEHAGPAVALALGASFAVLAGVVLGFGLPSGRKNM